MKFDDLVDLSIHTVLELRGSKTSPCHRSVSMHLLVYSQHTLWTDVQLDRLPNVSKDHEYREKHPSLSVGLTSS